MFYEEDLSQCDIDVTEASVYSGLCTEIFKEECVFQQKKVYCFVHLSIQEFLAALYVFHSYVTNNYDALKSFLSEEHWDKSAISSQDNLHVLLRSAVDEALKSRNGHLDLFLRFLMGISLEKNHRHLHGLLTHRCNTSKSIKDICQHIKQLNREHLSPERCINLFHCLLEMDDQSIHKEIQKYMSSPGDFKQKLSPAHCSALAHMLLMSEEVLDDFDLKKYKTSNEGRRRLLPALRGFKKARLAACKLTEKSCEILASVLQSPNSLTELDLSDNDLRDSGVQLLCKGLSSPHCHLQTLRLSGCGISDEGHVCLALTLMLNPSCVKALDVSNNQPGESAQQLLSAILEDRHQEVENLLLANSNLTAKSCEIVAAVLQSPNSLTELDLSDNDLGDSGVQLLSKGLSSPHCHLQILRLRDCLISEEGCDVLTSALTSNPSHLKELDLSYNHPRESAQKRLFVMRRNPLCNLETLRIDHVSKSRARQRLLKYACDLTLDPNTTDRDLSLSEGNRKVTRVREEQPYPDHPDRFDCWLYPQVLCREGLSGRCYWEAEWSEEGDGVRIAVAYKSTKKKGDGDDVMMGWNAKSWLLDISTEICIALHNNEHAYIRTASPRSRRVGVYLDYPAGTLSFYSVSSDTLTHLHTFHSTFTEPLYPGFYVGLDCSVSLCQIT
ncbi:hypothetical protein ACEWY4_017123 [Coilia grayii]|uniref:B30.2/SPRY domain-containing protein n=1 Tax=Coilia grayii TaxID=363190 RepID=A0ABD1JH18_9TELE